MSKKKLLIRFLVYTLVLFVLVGAFVWFFDPFYQYHKPFPGIKAVLMIETIRCREPSGPLIMIRFW